LGQNNLDIVVSKCIDNLGELHTGAFQQFLSTSPSCAQVARGESNDFSERVRRAIEEESPELDFVDAWQNGLARQNLMKSLKLPILAGIV